MAIIIDLVLLALLVLFFFLGWRKGLLLSLCGLVVAIVSFAGAGLLADTLDEPLANVILPKLTSHIEEQVSQHYSRQENDPVLFSPVDALREMGGIYTWAADALEDAQDAVGSTLSDTVHSVASQAARHMALRIAHSLVFVVVFLLLMVLLTILLHALDLVAKLPGLRFCNEVGGAFLGLLKGALILLVIVAVALIFFEKQLTQDVVEKTCLLKLAARFNPILPLFH